MKLFVKKICLISLLKYIITKSNYIIMSSHLTQLIILTLKFKPEDLSIVKLNDFKTNLQNIHAFEVLDIYNIGNFNYISLEIINNSTVPLHSRIENLLDNFTENLNLKQFKYLLRVYSVNDTGNQVVGASSLAVAADEDNNGLHDGLDDIRHDFRNQNKKYRRVHINKKGQKIVTNNASKNISI